MNFYAHYFEGISWLVLAEAEIEIVKKAAKGAGRNVGLAQVAVNKFNAMKTIASQVSANYKQNYDKKA